MSAFGFEAGPLSQWLRESLVGAGLEVVLLETRHVKAALSAMTVKTDRKDARGIAQLLRMGWYRPVHAKSPDSRDVRALLVGRKLLQGKLLDVELSIRGILRGYGQATPQGPTCSPNRFAFGSCAGLQRFLQLKVKQAATKDVIHPIHEVAALRRQGEPFRW